MKRYKVTKKHPFLKPHFRINQDKEDPNLYLLDSPAMELVFHKIEIKQWLTNRWIEEIKQPEFSAADVISILAKYIKEFGISAKDCDLKKLIKDWKG